MSGLLARITQRSATPVNVPGREPASQQSPAEGQVEPVLALSRELLHAVEQFVISTPDLDTPRFLQRLRGTAAGLTRQADAPTLRLFQDWARSALATFGGLQRRYVGEREEEMWRLLNACASSIGTGQASDAQLLTALRESHERLREGARLEDVRAARELLTEEVKQAQRLMEQKAREDRERIAALTLQISRLEATLAAVRGQASLDALTGLPHRGPFQQRLAQLVADGKPFSLAIIDLDDFKTINDTLGHRVGDSVIVLLADQLRRVVRSTDYAARYAGDEFCFLCVGSAPDQLAHRLAGAVARRHVQLELEDRVCSVLFSVSAGVAAWEPGDTAETLFHRADAALLAGKQTAKGRIRVAGPSTV